MSGWSKRDLALVLGFRALGDDYDKIACQLNREEEDVRSVVFKARCLYLTESWLCKLLDRQDDRQNLPVDLPQTKTWLPRKFTVSPVAVRERQPTSSELTASLMGDPLPGRSALDKAQSKEKSHGTRRPSI
ncbi:MULTISPECIES: hypothetical protein [unclassified Roseibium]|uniref:hypothetical protein n=1 Tax=unclassified Roseibium TaxID=2629323 RepID=UPI00273DE53C|nr:MULTISPECIES: hypothetical protein [unclassified Roseibium]